MTGAPGSSEMPAHTADGPEVGAFPTAAGSAQAYAPDISHRPIRVVLLGLVVGVLAPLLLLITGYGLWIIHLQRAEVDQGLRATVRALAFDVDQDVEGVRSALRTLALSSLLDTPDDLSAFHEQATRAAEPFDGWIVLGDRDMRQIVNTRLPYGSPLPALSLPELNRRTMTTGLPSVSGLFMGNVAQRPIVAVSAPVYGAAGVRYELRMAFVPERFTRLLQAQARPAGWVSLLLDAHHQVIARWPPDGKSGTAFDEAIKAALEQAADQPDRDIVHGVEFAGREYIVSITRSDLTGWLTVVAAPESLVTNPVTRATLILAGGALFSLCLAILAALVIGRRIAVPLQALAGQAEGIMRGAVTPAGRQPVREIDEVCRALLDASDDYRRHTETRLSLEREKRARELAEFSRAEMEKRERKSRRLIESNLIGVLIADEHRVIEANGVFLGMLGDEAAATGTGRDADSSMTTLPEAVGDGVPLGPLSPAPVLAGPLLQEPLLDEAAMRHLRENGEIAPFETLLLRRDGRRIPVLVGAARIEEETPGMNWVCFVVDLSQQRQTASDLKRSEERYRGLVEAISSIVWTANARGAIVEMQHWSELTGQPPQESAGRGWLQALHPEDRPATLANWSHAIDNRMPLDLEYRVRNRNGRYRWYHARGAPVLDGDGAVREWVGVCFDIDERKAAATRQLLLMAELDHRVRNILSTIQSMISLTGAGAASKEEYAALLQGRVSAMARTHGLLSRETWHGATLMQIVRDEVAPYLADSDSIDIDGDPEFTLRPKDALDFALVIHELMTNAAKYGALSVPGGRLSIRWHVVPGQELLVFKWQESGGPPVQPYRRQGFGTRLIDAVFSHSLGRFASCDFLPSGVSCTLTMPTRPTPDPVRNEGHSGPAAGEGDAKAPDPQLADAMPEGRILIVEDEPLIAMELHRLVVQAGLDVSGPAGTLDQALDLASDETLTGAILDINLGMETSYSAADRLIGNGVPVIFVTGYAAETVPERFAAHTVLQKPLDSRSLLAALRHELAGSAPANRRRARPRPMRQTRRAPATEP